MPKSEIAPPPRPFMPDGKDRRVGVEIEFAGIDTGRAAELVARLYGGDHVIETAHRHIVTGTPWGDFVVELDTRYAHPDKRLTKWAEEADEAWLADGLKVGTDIDGEIKEAIGNAVAGVVPVEIVCPPIPWHELGELDALFDGLREQGAEGTDANPAYGFGLHLNPEAPDFEAPTILAHLRAFLVMAEKLRATSKQDFTRRLLPHANPFPKKYMIHVLDPDYAPDLETLIADYAEANPTRNRELDMFPLFAHLAPDCVARVMDDPRIKARPTFHYRLPDARLSDPDWTAVTEWNHWVEIEALAADEKRLAHEVRTFLQNEKNASVLTKLAKTFSGESPKQ